MVAGRRRVVVTGIGCITPLGVRVEQLWKNLVAGASGVGMTTVFDASKFPTKIAAEVRGWDITHEGQEERRWHFCGRHVGVLLHLGQRLQRLQAGLREPRHVEGVAVEGEGHHLREGCEVLVALAAAQVHAQPRGISGQPVGEAGIPHRLQRGAGGEPRVAAEPRPEGVGAALVGDVPIADLGGDLRGKPGGVEDRRVAHARGAGDEVAPEPVDAEPERRDAPYPGDDDPPPARHHRPPPSGSPRARLRPAFTCPA